MTQNKPHTENQIMEFKDIIYAEQTGAATITINRPKVYNAFSSNTCEELIQAFGLAFSACAIGLTLGLMTGGRMPMSVTWTSLLALLPAMAGMMLGQRIRHRMQPEVFRRFFLIWMLVIGSTMLFKELL